MKILAETHIHTNASTHAYNTMGEMIEDAKKKGLELISITNHGPALPDSPHEWHFGNFVSVPRKIDGLYVLRGVEANIMDMSGTIDLPERILHNLDVVIASIHVPTLRQGTIEEHTNAYLGVLNNPYVDIIGHCGTPEYDFHIDTVLMEAKRLDKLIEINNKSFVVRKQSIENCRKIATRCKELGVKMVIGSDAHSIYELGDVGFAMEIVKEVGIGEELIMNTTAEKFLNYLCQRKGLDRNKFENTRTAK